MKKYLIVLSLFLLPLFASAQGFDQDLYYGLQDNNNVTELQEFLTDRGYYSGPITGNFFSLTLTAVKQFQAANSINQTGYFGPISRAKAAELLSISGISGNEITTENGTTIPVSTTAPKTTTDVVNSLLEQIKILQQQLAVLQQQNQQITQQTQVIQQQNETLQQIQQQITPAPEPDPLPIQQQSKASLEIVSPIPTKGLGRTYKASSQVIDELNYIYIGLIVRNDAGEPVKDVVVNVTATDGTQNKTLNGTGNVYPRYEGDSKIITPYYPFNYEFKTGGDHTITFTALGMVKSVTLTVAASDNQ